MHHFLFQVYPYIALSIAVMGCIARYERDPFTWKSRSSQLLRRRQLIWGSILFHVGVIVIFFGHLVGLLTPVWVFDTIGIGHGAKQILAIVSGGLAAIMALVGGGMLLHRRMFDVRVRVTSTFADTGILWLLIAQLVLGMATITVSMQHLDGSEMVNLMHWAQGIVYFQPEAAQYVAGAHWLFKAHILLGLTIFLIFPFTRLVHMLSVPVRYLWRPGYQIVRSRRRSPLPERAQAPASAPHTVAPSRPGDARSAE